MITATILILLSLYGIQYSPDPSGFSAGTTFTNSVRLASLIGIASASFGILLPVLAAVIDLSDDREQWGLLRDIYRFAIRPTAANVCQCFFFDQ